MRPTYSLLRPPTAPELPIARLHGRDAAIERAQRSAIGGLVLALFWLLPVLALGLCIVLST